MEKNEMDQEQAEVLPRLTCRLCGRHTRNTRAAIAQADRDREHHRYTGPYTVNALERLER
jgi:hypothetical protein